MRHVQLRLPAQRHPLEALRRARARRRARVVRVRPARCRRPARRALHAAGLRGGLHGLRPLRRGLPCQPRRRADAQGDQPHRARTDPRAGAAGRRLLRDAARHQPCPRRLRHRARHAVPAAALRVLRRLRRMRRDAVPQGADAALRRAADGGQRDRLLLHLRGQPPHHSVDPQRRRARAGLVQLAVRGQRRVRPRPAARRRPAHHPGARPAWPSCARRSGRTSPMRSSTPTRSASRRSTPSATG